MLESFTTDKFDYKKLSLEEQEKRGILGRLVGVIADTTNPTRNGRKYSAKLWEKVFNDPLMQEKINNRCLFGELGHPADREETDMEKIALCLAEPPKKGKDGKLYGVFDILSTPNGKILKTLCDYGCNIGVSSRGSGDLVTDYDGNESVDEDTYDCQGWDAVLVPAVKEARLQYVTEALETKKYNKTLKARLEESLEKASEDDKKVMKEALDTIGIKLVEELKSATPYMLRNDGKLLECGSVHPYVLYHIQDSLDKNIQHLVSHLDYLNWFYDNTNSVNIKEEIKSLVQSLVKSDYITDFDADSISFNFDTDKYVTDKDSLEELLIEVNSLTNQEFCKVRTSNMRFGGSSGDIYFRISSVNFNWFDIIWNLVNNNKNFITSVTVCKDTQTFGGRVEFYKVNGKILNQMPIDEFLTLSGNPVIENFNFNLDILNSAAKSLSEGKDILEAFGQLHPRYINSYMQTITESYLNSTFNDNLTEDIINESVESDLNEVCNDILDYFIELNYPITPNEWWGCDNWKDVKDGLAFIPAEIFETADGLMQELKSYMSATEKMVSRMNQGREDRIDREPFSLSDDPEYELFSEWYKDLSRLFDRANKEYANESLKIDKQKLQEARFNYYKYKYGVHVIGSDGRDRLLGGSKTLEGAENIGINQAKQIFESPWMTNQEKFKYLENMYIADDDEQQESRTTEFDDYVDGLMSELSSHKDESLDINEDQNTAVDNNEAMVEELQKSLKANKELKERLVELQNKLSVSYAKESKLEEQVDKQRSAISNLTKSVNKVSALNEQLNSLKSNRSSLSEELNSKNSEIDKLTETLNKYRDNRKALKETIQKKDEVNKSLNEQLRNLDSKNKKLEEQYSSITKDFEIKKNEFSRKLENSNNLVEKYKKIAKASVDKYIESQAIKYGITSNEIKTRLPESYNFDDIDKACQDASNYRVSFNRLPFNTMLNESKIKVRASEINKEALKNNNSNDCDDIDEQLLSLAESIK